MFTRHIKNLVKGILIMDKDKNEVVNEDELEVTGELEGTPNDDGGNDKESDDQDDKKFTQADLERMIGERLARDRKKREEEKRVDDLEESQKYKELYEAEKSKREAAEMDRMKVELIRAAGYSDDKLEFVKGIVNGSTEEEINASIDGVIAHMPPHADPNMGNSQRQQPPSQKDSDYGKELFDRINKRK